jgi:hypothetical protein
MSLRRGRYNATFQTLTMMSINMMHLLYFSKNPSKHYPPYSTNYSCSMSIISHAIPPAENRNSKLFSTAPLSNSNSPVSICKYPASNAVACHEVVSEQNRNSNHTEMRHRFLVGVVICQSTQRTTLVSAEEREAVDVAGIDPAKAYE